MNDRKTNWPDKAREFATRTPTTATNQPNRSIPAHDTEEKRENQEGRLHQTEAEQELDSLKEGIKQWDDVTDQQKEEEENEKNVGCWSNNKTMTNPTRPVNNTLLC